MFFRPTLYRLAEFWQGFRDLAPQAPGVAAWGLMTGVAMVKSGMSVAELHEALAPRMAGA